MKSIRMFRKSFFILPIIVSSIFLINGCTAGSKMSSLWQNNEIKIDGDVSEWNKNIQQIPDKKISIGFRNDDKFLYVLLVSEDRSKIMMIVRAGLIVWFEPESGDNNKFGIRYPMASAQPEALQISGMNRDGMEKEGLEKNIIRMLEQQNEFQIINKDKFPLTALPIMNDEGIEAKLRYRANQFIYELKVPLASNKQFSYIVDALPGRSVKIKFETEEMDVQSMPGGGPGAGGGMPPGGGRQGGGAGRQGGGGMKPGMGGSKMFEPLDYTVEIKLESALPIIK